MKLNRFTCCLCLLVICFSARAQLYKISIEKKIDNAAAVVEGKVTGRHSFWNAQHTMIYTANTIHIYKLFKGSIVSKQIEVVTQGGSVGNSCLVVSDVLQLRKGETGIFFCNENSLQMHSPVTKNILYDVYSSSQGFLKYDVKKDEAYAPFANYKKIKQTLYSTIKNRTGLAEKTMDASFDISTGFITNGTNGTAVLNSFSPATVHAGAINDDANNLLTINGSGFGDTPSGSAGIQFKDGNNDHTDPDYQIDYNSPYIVSWSDTKIVLHVPDRAATGKFAVVLNDGTVVTSTTDLNVFFSVLDAEFDLSNGDTLVKEPRLMNANGSGGYTFQYSSSTAGKGIDFSASPAKQTFLRAVNTWKEITGANFKEGATTTVQAVKDDGINLIVFDNNNTGVPRMADGVLEATYSWFSACSAGNDLLTAQKTGFDILVRNNAVSAGTAISLNNGPCFPQQKSYDLEMIILHELGHALNLAHINDDYEASANSYTTLNPSKVMHYAILDYVNRRSPDAAAYQGALYAITPQNNTYGNCGLFAQEMQPLTVSPITNDECPSTFPATEIAANTKIFFDLVHATSNKLKDPAFTQVNCNNTGTFVTNNAYYAFMNGSKTSISLNVSGYTPVPSDISGCSGAGTRLALYDVSTCPQAQSYPQPAACLTFNGNGTLTLNGLQTAHKYLLYFDGLRNTKASFSVTFNSDSSAPSNNNTTINVFPNPVVNNSATLQIINASGSFYEYALFDIAGRLIKRNKITVVQSTQTIPLYLNNLPAGVYVLRLADETGKVVTKRKILKL